MNAAAFEAANDVVVIGGEVRDVGNWRNLQRVSEEDENEILCFFLFFYFLFFILRKQKVHHVPNTRALSNDSRDTTPTLLSFTRFFFVFLLINNIFLPSKKITKISSNFKKYIFYR